MCRRLLVLIALLIGIDPLPAADWPAWRGPTGQGYCTEVGLPLKWGKTENVKWKVAMPDDGNSTPVIWGDKIFVTQANKGGSVRGLMCLARADGKLIWEHKVDYPDKERNWQQNWYCNASPTTDGERVIVSYGSAGMYCYDFSGKVLWKRDDLGKWEHAFGNGASPVLYGDTVIQWCGPNADKGRNFLLAANKKTGATVWEHEEKVGSWSTPLIAKVDGRDQLLLAMSGDVKTVPEDKTGFLKGFDPKTGKELWRCQGINSYVYTSPLFSNGVAVQMSGFHGSALAVKLGGQGDITKDRLWLHPKNIQRVGSGIIVGEHVYLLEENGMPHCYELQTGKEVWQVDKKPGSNSWSSMVLSGDRLYVCSHNGDTYVFAARPKYELLATNRLGEYINASIAPSNGEIFIRTYKHLWCISDKQ